MTLLSSERLYTGRIVNLDRDAVGFPDGSIGQLEMVRHPGASAVVPFVDDPNDPDPRVLLIRQFRHAADGFIWEVPAGRLDPGESPEDCARRELEEETGHRARDWRPAFWRARSSGSRRSTRRRASPTSGFTCSSPGASRPAPSSARRTSSWKCTCCGGRGWAR